MKIRKAMQNVEIMVVLALWRLRATQAHRQDNHSI